MIAQFQFRQRLAVWVGALLFTLPSLWAQTNSPERGQIPAGAWHIAGTVVNANTGSPLPRARVTIMDAKERQNFQTIVSSEAGRFEFHVPAGKFALQGAKRGFITAAYNQHDQFSTAIVTGAAGIDSEHLSLRLAPNAVLAGKVLDEFGEPVRQAEVMMYKENRFAGVSQISRYRGAATDDQGKYEVTPLDAGTYFVSAKAAPWYAMHPPTTRPESSAPPVQVSSGLDVVYPLTFYADSTEADQATPIPVRGGDRLEVDIHLNPTPALHLSFRANQNGSAGYPQLQRKIFDEVEDVQPGNVEMISPGVFELTGVGAGSYLVRMPDSAGQLKEPTMTNLASSQELDPASGNSTATVTVKVLMVGGGTVPPGVQVALRGGKGTPVTSAVDARGQASFSDVLPGKYDVLAGSANEDYSVTGIAWEGGSTSGRTLDVASGAALSVSASLLQGSVTIDGFAKRTGKGFDGAMVVLIPDNPEANKDRFRRDQTDLDGSFTLFNVTPGKYRIFAIENGWDLDWAKPAVLERYGREGQRITVSASEKGTLHLPGAVEVAFK